MHVIQIKGVVQTCISPCVNQTDYHMRSLSPKTNSQLPSSKS